MKMTNNSEFLYRVTIRPTGSYFFGGERTFNPADKSKANYFVRSRTTPQQTTILGMLRFALLKKFVDVELNNKSEDALIGESGFNGKNTNYGVIEKISPLFLQYNDQFLDIAGLDHQIYDNELQVFSFKKTKEKSYLDKTQNYNSANIKNFIPQVKGYNHKKFMSIVWCNSASKDKKYISEDEIFISDVRPGNKKSQTVGVDKHAYYKQERYRLQKGYSFAVYLTTSQKLKLSNNNTHSFLIPIGGDNTECRIDISKINAENNHFNKCDEVNNTSTDKKIILLSDALISQKTLRKVDFSINFLSEFRYIQTTNLYPNSAQIQLSTSTNNSLPKKSSLLFLLSRGSVLYGKSAQIDNVICEIEKENTYRNIGYNWFKTELIN